MTRHTSNQSPSQLPAPNLPVRRRRLIIAVAVGAVTIDTALLGLIAPLLPEIEERTGASDAALGISLAVYAAPVVLFSLPLGRAADEIGRRPLLIAGLLLTAGGSAVIAVSDSLAVLMAGRAVQGLGAAASWIAALAVVSDLAPAGKRGEAIGIAFAANSIGSIAGPALGGVTADLLGFAAPFLIVCATSTALAAAVTAVFPHEGEREPTESPALRTIVGATRSGIGAVATAITLGGAGVLGVVELVAPLDLDARLGLSSSAIGLLFALSIAVDAPLAPIGGRWGDRRGRQGPAVTGLALLALSVALLAAFAGTLGAAIALALFGAGFSLSFAAAVPWLDEAFGAVERGLGYGLLNLLYAAGYAIGPVVGGVLLELGSADAAYLLTAVVLGAGAAAVLAWARASTTTAPSR
jgi:MFS transporter, DHA1 family, solute carrier family 18 (vesicular amine transporter), member 1/2